MICQESIHHGPQRDQIVCAKECPPRRNPLEVVYHTQMRPRPRQTPQRVLIYDAAHQRHIAGRQTILAQKFASTPGMEGMRDFHPVVRLQGCDTLLPAGVRQGRFTR